MTKIDWKSKLTSRKFWAAVIGFITAILVAFNVDNLTIEQVVSVISACSVIIAYIVGEGLVDRARLTSTSTTSTPEPGSTNVIGFISPATKESDGE